MQEKAKKCLLVGGSSEIEVKKSRFIANIFQIETVEQAEMLRNCYLEIDREDAVPLEEGTYYIVDLLESDIFTDEGEYLGKLEDIYNTGAKDIYVVKNELGKTILLPGIPEVIKEVNLEEKKITVHLLKGLV